MTVTAPEETWTAPRLDELNERVNVGFEKGEAAVSELRGEMNARFEKVDKRFEKVDKRFEKVDERFDKTDAKMEAGFKEVRGEMKAGFERFDRKFDKLMWTMLAVAGSIICVLISLIGILLKTRGGL